MMQSAKSSNKQQQNENGTVILCASCDRCRSRKTRCDGNQPCSGCATKYMKMHNLQSIEGIDVIEFGCVYSPAKRRGPVPGKTRKRQPKEEQKCSQVPIMPVPCQDMHQIHTNGFIVTDSNINQVQPIAHVQMNGYLGENHQLSTTLDGIAAAINGGALSLAAPQAWLAGASVQTNLRPAQRQRQSLIHDDSLLGEGGGGGDSIAVHLNLLGPDSTEGNHLRALYRLSVDELVMLPPIPTNQAYCQRLGALPKSARLTLMAARFAEIALGAIVRNDFALAPELCNAAVSCLQDAAPETSWSEYEFEVARTYFLLSVFRAFQGDMTRYFKYRRVCITHVSKLNGKHKHCDLLLGAIAYMDSWAYNIYNANEGKLPLIDKSIPQVAQRDSHNVQESSQVEQQYNISCNAASIAADKRNQMWIQGAPPVYLNNEAPLSARSLDALSCAIRSCCDQATAERNKTLSSSCWSAGTTPTATAVMAHQDELCSRNLVVSARALLQQHEAFVGYLQRSSGHHLIIAALEAFLVVEKSAVDNQIKSLLKVCNILMENPLILYHAGPTYHMASNAAIMLCHIMNGMLDTKSSSPLTTPTFDEKAFDQVLDTFMCIRMIINTHRQKLPLILRCHEIPRPNIGGMSTGDGSPFVDLGKTPMCGSHGCQGFVLMGCSPCVAAERAKANQDAFTETNHMDAGLSASSGAESELNFSEDEELFSMLSHVFSK